VRFISWCPLHCDPVCDCHQPDYSARCANNHASNEGGELLHLAPPAKQPPHKAQRHVGNSLRLHYGIANRRGRNWRIRRPGVRRHRTIRGNHGGKVFGIICRRRFFAEHPHPNIATAAADRMTKSAHVEAGRDQCFPVAACARAPALDLLRRSAIAVADRLAGNQIRLAGVRRGERASETGSVGATLRASIAEGMSIAVVALVAV
jgi:hypothetical protein